MIRNTVSYCSAGLTAVIFLSLTGCQLSPGKKTQEEAGDLFADHIRRTDFQTPEEEQAGFILPPGFEITLFASEPDINKPINMEFDAAGRLWVTHTTEYPMPAPPGQGSDRITILEDSDGDGKADKFIPFASQLNIPIGLTPVHRGAIAYSIPHIYRFTDTDGDGIADEKKKLVGPFEYVDTHGMVNNLIRGFDGWIHACHGYANTSTVAGADGDSITMSSGNTFRFREDGSRVEATTFGRINPFGFAFDEWGYLYSLDCHTKPIYQLIPGAQYPAQGVKAPTIGWAPEMMSYEFGSTANSGLVFYTGDQFPEAYRNNFFSGNVVTSRINRNTMTLHGSSPESTREEDFLISKDPWFRPVDLKVGPDGALYVADFYNRIIGHYEVPKEHPGRDRVSGRIWRIAYTGDSAQATSGNTPGVPKDWSRAPLNELIEGLGTGQLNLRMTIANRIVDEFGVQAADPVRAMMEARPDNSKAFIQGLWILHRLQRLPEKLLEKALHHQDPMTQVHALRVLGERQTIAPEHHRFVVSALDHRNPQVTRIAAQVLGSFPRWESLNPLLSLYIRTPARDTHLRYTCLLSIRDHLKTPAIIRKVSTEKWSEEELGLLLYVMPEVPSAEAASFVLDYLRASPVPADRMKIYLAYISRHVAGQSLDEVVHLIRNTMPDDPDEQFGLYETIRRGSAQRGEPVSELVQAWGISIARQFLGTSSRDWTSSPLGNAESSNPWTSTRRHEYPGFPAAQSLTSQLNGFHHTGVLYSAPFTLPPSLSLTVFDNDLTMGAEKKGQSRNAVRVRLAENNALLEEYRLVLTREATQDDELAKVTFNLKKYAGQQAYLEVVDSSSAGFIGISDIEPQVLSIPERGPGDYALRQIHAAGIAADYRSIELAPALEAVVFDPAAGLRARAAAVEALMGISAKRYQPVLKSLFGKEETPAWLKGQLAHALVQLPSSEVYELLAESLSGAAPTLQEEISLALVSSPRGIDHFLNALQAKRANDALLNNSLIRARMDSYISPAQQQLLDQLLGQTSGRDDREALVKTRISEYDPATVSLDQGKVVFTQYCSPCHTIGNQGGVIGPQLNGIGTWGLQALAEKILDPNRNISEAFRTYTITLNNGRVLSGLYRREEGELLVFADPGGQEFSVSKSEIKERKPTGYTLMPDNFGTVLDKREFDALLTYLLSIKEN